MPLMQKLLSRCGRKAKKWLESRRLARNNAPGGMKMIEQKNFSGSFTLPGKSMTLNRMGYGAMQLAGPGVRDVNTAIAVLREVVSRRREIVMLHGRWRSALRSRLVGGGFKLP
jgi:hypothetical protein